MIKISKEVQKVVSAFEEAINQNRIIGSQCEDCNHVSVPPRPICRVCWSDKIDFTTVDGRGKLVTWTEIHIAPPSYTDMAPYTLAIVELTNGESLSGILKLPENVEPKFDMEMVAVFEEGVLGTKRLRWALA